ncbi:hypothetical protein CLV44_101226 [Marinobacterium halophilum]|uniref:DUF1853 family protein n=1 Tax=Marinobacterium halophilum TaxID=267374 RepID=A0A2P8F527_9GAMM|nr:DUF1853 family protein [Marinobacterium halophilum]PSL16826.1 hypothetical protein CLV44_101226 [Marinobacterium halophilum]
MSANAEQPRFQQPVMRHLAWLCSAPQLYRGAETFDPLNYLPADYLARLIFWDRHPEHMPACLRQPAPRRLGLYFEQLYACLLSDVLEWPLLARNRQIMDGKRTLGELDFLVRNPLSGAVEHHEIAVKFYLGYLAPAAEQTLWYGPDSRDRLDLKTARLLGHQSGMAARPEARPLLAEFGLTMPPRPRIFMPGYLFYPEQSALDAPAQTDMAHGRGQWCHVSQLAGRDANGWVVLRKPHWLGVWEQASAPAADTLITAADEVCQTGQPRLLARLAVSSAGWQEVERLFVVPDAWPGRPSTG